MTLDGIFEKYQEPTNGFYRRKTVDELKERRKFLTEKDAIECVCKYSLKWLKELKIYANQKYIEIGFCIPDFVIEDANADDWEFYDVECST